MASKKVAARYIVEAKTLEIDAPKSDLVPAYAYYYCMYLSDKNKIDIQSIKFNDSNLVYSLKDLKGKKTW